MRFPICVVIATAALALYMCGCISSAPIVPVTPANQAQVSSCQGIASLHNGVVLGDMVFGGSTTVLAAVSAFETTSSAKNATSIAGVITGGLSVIGTAIAAYTASDFGDSQCSMVVGPLPAAAQPKGAQ